MYIKLQGKEVWRRKGYDSSTCADSIYTYVNNVYIYT